MTELFIKPRTMPETMVFDSSPVIGPRDHMNLVRVYSRSPESVGLQIRTVGPITQSQKGKDREAFSHATLTLSEVRELIGALLQTLLDRSPLVDKIAVLRANGARFAVIEESDDTVTLQGWAGPHVVTKRDLAIRYEVQS
jgi:hypothetical protein